MATIDGRSLQPWTEQEVSLLATMFPDASVSKTTICTTIPNHTWRGIMAKAHSLGMKRRLIMQYSVIPDYFDEIDTFDRAYHLGLMMSDGYTTNKNGVGLKVHPKDRRLVETLISHLSPDYTIKEQNGGRTVGFELYDGHLHASLQTLGVTPHKHLTLNWPTKMGDEHIIPFVAGMFDGDGCLSWTKDASCAADGYWRWTLLAREEMLFQIKSKLATIVDVRISDPRKMSSGNVHYICINGKAAAEVDALMSEFPIGLSRKRIHGHPHTLSS